MSPCFADIASAFVVTCFILPEAMPGLTPFIRCTAYHYSAGDRVCSVRLWLTHDRILQTRRCCLCNHDHCRLPDQNDPLFRNAVFPIYLALLDSMHLLRPVKLCL